MLLLWPQTGGTEGDKTLTYLHESIINTKHFQKDMRLIKSPGCAGWRWPGSRTLETGILL